MREKIIELICIFLPVKRRIVFESNPEFSCNTLPVYEEMVRRGIRENYQIYWLVENADKFKMDSSGNRYLNYNEKGLKRIAKEYILATSKVLIFSNRILCKRNKRQFVINLTHGSPLKKTPGYHEGDTCDFVVTESSYFNEAMSNGLGVPFQKVISLGFPRTDVLNGTYNSRKILGLSTQSKLIVWMPTFRRNKNSGEEYGEVKKLGVPLLNTLEDFSLLNDELKLHNSYLLIKLHPVEDVMISESISFSNIRFITDNELVESNLTAYKLLADSDALLTDYSSVYYDYLLLNKPIGLVTDNLEEFTKEIGFYYGDFKSFIKGSYIENLKEFVLFINDISNGYDRDVQNREWAINKYCEYKDFESTKRVVDFILERI